MKMAIAGAGTIVGYMTLNDWVMLATLVYVTLNTGLLLPKYYQLIKAWRHGKKIKLDQREN